jgi:hypothetical protein
MPKMFNVNLELHETEVNQQSIVQVPMGMVGTEGEGFNPLCHIRVEDTGSSTHQ